MAAGIVLTAPKEGYGGDEAEGTLRPGETIQGKYVVRHLIGSGGMCVVASATHVQLDQVVALKVLRRSIAKNAEMVERFLREARAAARLKSEHVAHVFDVGTLETGEPFMVMEYLDGSDLGAMLDVHGALQLRDAVDFVMQACEAVGEAHAEGLVHRDLKPENLFLTRRADGTAQIKVLDFGIAKALTRSDSDPAAPIATLTQASTTFGTPTYMSPEQLRSAHDVDARADIWALGVILYELTSGRAPFDGSSIADLHAAILMEEPEPLHDLNPDIPVEFSAVVERCLCKDRADRYADVVELARDLVPFASDRGYDYVERVARVVNNKTPTLPAPPAGSNPAGVLRSPRPRTPPGVQRSPSDVFDSPSKLYRLRQGLGSDPVSQQSNRPRTSTPGRTRSGTPGRRSISDDAVPIPLAVPHVVIRGDDGAFLSVPSTSIETPTAKPGREYWKVVAVCAAVLGALSLFGLLVLGLRRAAPAVSPARGDPSAVEAPAIPATAASSVATVEPAIAPSVSASLPPVTTTSVPASTRAAPRGGTKVTSPPTPAARKPPTPAKTSDFDPFGQRK